MLGQKLRGQDTWCPRRTRLTAVRWASGAANWWLANVSKTDGRTDGPAPPLTPTRRPGGYIHLLEMAKITAKPRRAASTLRGARI